MAVRSTWRGDELIEQLERGIVVGLQGVATDWLDAWQQEWDPASHPYMTGRARDEGATSIQRDGDTFTLVVYSPPDYLVFEELGTSHQHAHHPLLRSVDAITPEIPMHLLKGIETAGIPSGTARVDVVGGVSVLPSAFSSPSGARPAPGPHPRGG